MYCVCVCVCVCVRHWRGDSRKPRVGRAEAPRESVKRMIYDNATRSPNMLYYKITHYDITEHNTT